MFGLEVLQLRGRRRRCHLLAVLCRRRRRRNRRVGGLLGVLRLCLQSAGAQEVQGRRRGCQGAGGGKAGSP